MDLTLIVPFWRGHDTLPSLLNSIPETYHVIVVNDYESDPPYIKQWENVDLINLDRRGYFSGACNAGFDACDTDVLILNQDVRLKEGWEQLIVPYQANRSFATAGDGVMGHPAWEKGYVQGTFMYVSRDALDEIGGFDEQYWPLWGATSEWQLRACRAGYWAEPMDVDEVVVHSRKGTYGDGISSALTEEPDKKKWLVRTPPLVSVIITAYNHEAYIAQGIESVLNQTFQGIEIIVVDDASHDRTAEIVREYVDPWKGVRFYWHRNNAGASAAANTGIEHAYGRYVTVLDGDDMMAPTRIEEMQKLAEQYPHSFVYDDTMWLLDNGKQVPRRMQEYDFERLLYKNQMHKGILYPRSAWKAVGGYSLLMDDGREDWAFNVGLGLYGYCGVHFHKPLYIYRRQGQGRTERKPKPRHYFLEKIKRLYPRVYELGERPMGCCGSQRNTSNRRASRSARTVSNAPQTSETTPCPGDMVRMKYTGASIGKQTIAGPSYTRYKYGRTARYLHICVKPEDVDFLLETGQFVEDPLPVEPEAERVEPEPEDVVDPEPLRERSEPDTDETLDLEIDLTSAAQALTEEHNIGLIDLMEWLGGQGSGVDGRVLKSDVQGYVDAH